MRVNRADDALRQKDRYNEMDAIAKKMSKLVKKGSKEQQAESDRVMKTVNWAMVKDSMQIRYELDAVIHEVSDTIQEIEKEKKKMGRDEFCEKLFERDKGGGKMRIQVTKPRHGEEKFCSLQEMTLRMMQEGRIKCKECKEHWQVGEKVQQVQKPWR